MTREEAEAYLDTGAEPTTMTPEEAEAFLDGKAVDHEECDSCKAGGPCTGCAAETPAGIAAPPTAAAPAEEAGPRIKSAADLAGSAAGAIYGPLGNAIGMESLGPAAEGVTSFLTRGPAGYIADKVMQDPEASARGAVQGATFRLADEISGAAQAPFLAAKSGMRLGDAYRARQQQSLGEFNEAAARSPRLFPDAMPESLNPSIYEISEGAGGMAIPGGAAAKFIGRAKSPLGAAARSGAVGSAYAGASGVGGSDANLATGGEYGQAAFDALMSAAVGGPLAAVIGGAAAGRVNSRSAKAAGAKESAEKFKLADEVKTSEETLGQRQQVENQIAKEKNAAAKAEAEAETARLETAAADEAKVPTRDQALVYAGLEGDTAKMGGARRAVEKAQALFDEPMVDMGPGSSALRELNKLPVAERGVVTKGQVDKKGAEFGEVLSGLDKKGATVPRPAVLKDLKAGPGGIMSLEEREMLREVIKQVKKHGGTGIRRGQQTEDAFFPTEAKVLLDDIGKTKGGGRIPAFARRVLVKHLDEAAKAKLTGEEFTNFKGIAKSYGRWKDLDRGSVNLLKRYSTAKDANKRSPIAEDVVGVKPRAVEPKQAVEVEPKQAELLEFPGGPEALAQTLADLDATTKPKQNFLMAIAREHLATKLPDLLPQAGYSERLTARRGANLFEKLMAPRRGPITRGAKVAEAQRQVGEAGERLSAAERGALETLRKNPRLLQALLQQMRENAEAEQP